MNQAKSFSVIDRDVTTSIFSRNPCTHTLILHLEESQNQGKEINERKKPEFLFIMSIMIITVSIVIIVIVVFTISITSYYDASVCKVRLVEEDSLEV